MAHNIYTHKSGEAAMAFTGDRKAIWHGLGQQIPENATSRQVIEACHGDYDVILKPIFCQIPYLEEAIIYQEIESHRCTVRADTGDVLGVVGTRYCVVQNHEAFAWLDQFEGLQYRTAGVLGGGERMWILAEYPGLNFKIGHRDIQHYILFTNSHDGTQVITAGATPTVVVCQNTLNFALGKGLVGETRVKHTKCWKEGLEECARVLELQRKYNKALQEACENLALAPMTWEQAVEYTMELVPTPEDAKIVTRTENIRTDIVSLFTQGMGNKGESRWDWLNGVSEYVDHYRGVRGSGSVSEARFKSVLFGSGLAMKQRAFDLVTADL